MSTRRAVAHLLSAAAVAWAPVAPAPVAAAVTPPKVDGAALPPPGPPAPPRRTEQREPCVQSDASGAESAEGTAQLGWAQLESLWQLTRGAGQTIAIVDTGVARHRLLPHLVPGGDFVSSGDGTQDCDGHGTIVAGIVGAAPDPATGFAGVAPEATLIAIRQSSNRFADAEDPSGSGFGDVDTLASAVRTAADLGATVINVSSVACLSEPGALDDRALGAALAYAVDTKNAVVVAAAGNVGGAGQCPDQNPTGDAEPDWGQVKVVVSPPWYDDYVLTVGSVAADGQPSAFSLAGPWVDVAAPGEDVVSVDPDGEGLVDHVGSAGGPAPISGTSYAAPLVSGVAALVRSRWPQLSARQVMRRIEETAMHPASGWNPVVGQGVVDPLAAVSDRGPTRPAPVYADVAAPAPEPPRGPDDRRGVQVAVRGAAICAALTAAAVAAMVSSGRLRRTGDGVTHD